METSPEIDKLVDALAKAQGQFAKAERSRTNTNFKSKYATHADIVDAIRTPLSENGLAFMQSPVEDGPDGGAITVETFLAHSSGQWIKGYITLTIGRFAAGGVKTIDAQAYMSGFTSAKRIGLTALCGVSLDEGDAEDDGNAAAAQGAREYPPPQNGQAARPTQNGNARSEKPQNYPINLDAINEIKALCGAAYDAETTSKDWFGKSLQNLTAAQGAEFIRDITAQRDRDRLALLQTPMPPELEMVGEETAPQPPSASEQTMGAIAR